MDTRKTLQESRAWVQEQLKISVEFWLKNGMDPKHGGVYTCLDRKGEIYSTDKSVLSVPCVRSEGRVAEGQQELPGLYGEVLHQPPGRGPDVFYRH